MKTPEPTIKRQTIEYDITPAPSSPLNLRLGVIYAPREPDPNFAGYSCMQVGRGEYVVAGWATGHTATILETNNLPEAYVCLARSLRMAK